MRPGCACVPSDGPKSVETQRAQKGKTMKTYIVISKEGMPPWATCKSRRQAAKESRAARRLGLDGTIIEYVDGVSLHYMTYENSSNLVQPAPTNSRANRGCDRDGI